MPYIEMMESGLRQVVRAGEEGRRSVDGMLAPITGAVSDLTGAADELSTLPGFPAGLGDRALRLTRSLGVAQAKVGGVMNTYSSAARALSGLDQRYGALADAVSKVTGQVGRLAGVASPKLANIIPTGLRSSMTPSAAASKPFAHLLVMQPRDVNSSPFYFNLDTAAFDELRRQTAFRWAAQERLTRRPAQQAVGEGEDKLTLKGAVFGVRVGLGQIEQLREIGRRQVPLSLTTGYGQVLGLWCLASIEEEQSALVQGGAPRKQAFSLEFVRYGDDLQNV
ncbi:phage tail protein [Pseudomonas aeruginosa]